MNESLFESDRQFARGRRDGLLILDRWKSHGYESREDCRLHLRKRVEGYLWQAEEMINSPDGRLSTTWWEMRADYCRGALSML